jgi:hypothetical protein
MPDCPSIIYLVFVRAIEESVRDKSSNTSSLIQNPKRKTELVLGIWKRRSIPKKIRETTSKGEMKCLV